LKCEFVRVTWEYWYRFKQ